MKGFRLPDGTETFSSRKYIYAWEKLAEPIKKMTGLNHIAFDPGIQFVSDKHLITLPKWFIELLNNYYTESQELVIKHSKAYANLYMINESSILIKYISNTLSFFYL